jgi:hypothetical protein
MAGIEQMYETCLFKKELSAERSFDSRSIQAKKSKESTNRSFDSRSIQEKKSKESTNAKKKKSIVVPQSRLNRLIGARPRKKKTSTKVRFAANEKF